MRKLHQEVKKKEWDVTLVDSSQGSDTEERDFGKLQSLHWFASIILFLSAILFPGSTLLRVKATSRVTLQGQQDNTATTDLERKLLWKFALDKFFMWIVPSCISLFFLPSFVSLHVSHMASISNWSQVPSDMVFLRHEMLHRGKYIMCPGKFSIRLQIMCPSREVRLPPLPTIYFHQMVCTQTFFLSQKAIIAQY